MLSGVAGVKPVSGRGLLFLVAFVSFLTLSLLGPHIHGAAAAPTPVTAAAATTATATAATATATAAGTAATATTAASTAVAGAPSATAAEALGATQQPAGETLGIAAACVLVLLLTIVFFAAIAAPRPQIARPRPALHVWIPERAPRGAQLPIFRLLSISRT